MGFKNKIIGGITFIAIVAVCVLNVSLSMKDSLKKISAAALMNLETLAAAEGTVGEGNGGGVMDCPILLYNRNYMEDYYYLTVTGSAYATVTVTWKGKSYPGIKIGSKGTVTIKIPYCKESTGNCCIKTHIDKKIEYVNV